MIRDELHTYEIIARNGTSLKATYCTKCVDFLRSEGKTINLLDDDTEDSRCYFYRHKEIKALFAKHSGSAQNP